MYSQSSPDTQTPRDDTFSQECVKPDVWGKLYATKEKFPYLGNALQLWYIVVVFVVVRVIFVYYVVRVFKSEQASTISTLTPALHSVMTLYLMLC
jgi:hypothetical protein